MYFLYYLWAFLLLYFSTQDVYKTVIILLMPCDCWKYVISAGLQWWSKIHPTTAFPSCLPCNHANRLCWYTMFFTEMSRPGRGCTYQDLLHSSRKSPPRWSKRNQSRMNKSIYVAAGYLAFFLFRSSTPLLFSKF